MHKSNTTLRQFYVQKIGCDDIITHWTDRDFVKEGEKRTKNTAADHFTLYVTLLRERVLCRVEYVHSASES